MGLNYQGTSIMNLIKIKGFVLAVIAGALLTGCSSDDLETAIETVPDTPVASKTYYMSVNASKGGSEEDSGANNMPRRALSLSENQKTLVSTWAKTERIYVKYYDNWFDGYLQPNKNGGTAFLNGSLTANNFDFTIPEGFELQFPRKNIDYTGQIGTIEDIAANYDYATTVPHVDKVEGNNITAAAPVTFVNQQAIVRFTLQDQDGNPLSVSKLLISGTGLKKNGTELGDIEINPTSSTNVIFAALSGIDGTITLTATGANGNAYVYSKSNIKFANGEYRRITVKMHSTSTDAINLSDATTDQIGHVVGEDGKVYANSGAATSAGTTAVAMIAYISEKGKGLAIALNDDSEMTLDDALSAASGKTPTVDGCKWKLPLHNDWENMAAGCGGFGSINSKLVTAGGTSMSGTYWSSMNYENIFFSGSGADYGQGNEYVSYKVRACLVFPSTN